jgi:Tol biopolymer transport system component
MRWFGAFSAALALVVLFAPLAREPDTAWGWSPGTVRRLSFGLAGGAQNADARGPSTSDGGAFTAFVSAASDLVPNDLNGCSDVFVVRRSDNAVERVSVDLGGGDANGPSTAAAISADGHFVAFVSLASDLVTGDTNGCADVFVRDLQLDSTVLVSHSYSGNFANGPSGPALAISADGRFVAFESAAPNIVPNDGNGATDVFRWDSLSGSSEAAVVFHHGATPFFGTFDPAISDDGDRVCFSSRSDSLAPGDTNKKMDVFVRDFVADTMTHVSGALGGLFGNGDSDRCTISGNGRYVAFVSQASNLIAGDGNGVADVFVRDLATGALVRASVDSSGAESNGGSMAPSISRDGRFLAFTSSATNLVVGDSNGCKDVFLRDLVLGTTMGLTLDTTGQSANSSSVEPSLARDGSWCALASSATDLVLADPQDSIVDVFASEVLPPPPFNYCTSGTSLAGCSAQLGFSGLPSASATSGFVLHVHNVDGSRPGSILVGSAGPYAIPFWPGSPNWRCVAPPLRKLGIARSSGPAGSCLGTFQFDFNAWRAAHPASLGAPLSAGDTVWAQAWWRDPQSSWRISTSNALEFVLGL